MCRNNNWSRRNYISGPGQQRKQQLPLPLPLVTRDKARRAGAAASLWQGLAGGSQVAAAAAAVWQAQVLSGV